MSNPYSVKLTIATPEVTRFRGRDVFRVVITASDPVDMPKEIFLHQRTLVDPVTGASQDELIAICSPYDLSAYPANSPNLNQTPPYFRKDRIDILLPSVTVLQDFLTNVKESVCLLLSLMRQLDLLEVEEEFWCEAPEGPTTTTTSTTAGPQTTTTTTSTTPPPTTSTSTTVPPTTSTSTTSPPPTTSTSTTVPPTTTTSPPTTTTAPPTTTTSAPTSTTTPGPTTSTTSAPTSTTPGPTTSTTSAPTSTTPSPTTTTTAGPPPLTTTPGP